MKRVLLIRLTALGDVILVEPVARALKAQFPGVQVDLVTEVQPAPLMDRAESFDRVITYDRRGADAGWSGIARVAQRVGSQPYDLILDLQGKLRTRILARRVSAQKRLRYKKRTLWGGILSLFGVEPPLTGTHAVDLYLRPLRPYGIEAQAESRPQLAARLPRQDQTLHIGLSAGTAHATKQWPARHFAALAEALEQENPQVKFTLFGGPKDREMLANIRTGYEGKQLSDLDTTTMSVDEMSQVIRSLDLFVGVDSGPSHIAAALGIPVVVLFGPTSSSRWGPRGQPHEAVSLDLECAPCSNTGGAVCPDRQRQHACMRELQPTQVQTACLRVLQNVEATT